MEDVLIWFRYQWQWNDALNGLVPVDRVHTGYSDDATDESNDPLTTPYVILEVEPVGNRKHTTSSITESINLQCTIYGDSLRSEVDKIAAAITDYCDRLKGRTLIGRRIMHIDADTPRVVQDEVDLTWYGVVVLIVNTETEKEKVN